jgi:phosphatidylglycerophosphate synthase
VAKPPLTRRRLLGLDRSGGPPPETLRQRPLRPLTLPNLVGFLRLAGVPVFLVLALGSDDGRETVATILFAAIAFGDYVDGLVARLTGQYSRLGALMDPFIDRLVVVVGAAVVWHFELLPRWALAVLAVREVITLVLAQLALRRGVDLEINWVGRWSVWLTMGGIFLALATDAWIGPAMFLVGLVGSLLASALYLKAGLSEVRVRLGEAGRSRPGSSKSRHRPG